LKREMANEKKPGREKGVERLDHGECNNKGKGLVEDEKGKSRYAEMDEQHAKRKTVRMLTEPTSKSTSGR